jgi:hypothetical protein
MVAVYILLTIFGTVSSFDWSPIPQNATVATISDLAKFRYYGLWQSNNSIFEEGRHNYGKFEMVLWQDSDPLIGFLMDDREYQDQQIILVNVYDWKSNNKSQEIDFSDDNGDFIVYSHLIRLGDVPAPVHISVQFYNRSCWLQPVEAIQDVPCGPLLLNDRLRDDIGLKVNISAKIDDDSDGNITIIGTLRYGVRRDRSKEIQDMAIIYAVVSGLSILGILSVTRRLNAPVNGKLNQLSIPGFIIFPCLYSFINMALSWWLFPQYIILAIFAVRMAYRSLNAPNSNFCCAIAGIFALVIVPGYFFWYFGSWDLFLFISALIFLPELYQVQETAVSPWALLLIASSNVTAVVYMRCYPHNIFEFKTSWVFFGLYIATQALIFIWYSIAYVTTNQWHNRPPAFDYFQLTDKDIYDEEGREKLCAICLESLSAAMDAPLLDVKPKKNFVKTPCNHEFHAFCLGTWMNTKQDCPTCRTRLPPFNNDVSFI